MDADDLDYRTRTLSGCIPPHLVSRLLELGHTEEVEFQAGNGEWFCAREQARILGEQDRRDEALDVLAPFRATGWWPAAEATAELLEHWGRADEAIALVRPHAESGNRLALASLACLFGRQGRADEAIALLRPRAGDPLLAATVVGVARDAGLDEDAAALLTDLIAAGRRRDRTSFPRRGVAPDNAVGLLAAIRERQGRADDAIALLLPRSVMHVNASEQLADLLARHGRSEELRTYAVTESQGHAATLLADLLEERGDVDGAIAVLKEPGGSSARRLRTAVHLSHLLARHGRGDEAIAVMRALADSPDRADDWIVETLCTLYADLGRPEEGLAYLDSLAARRGGEDWDAFLRRLPLLVACGRRDEALAGALAHPEGGTSYAACTVAALLAEGGRTEEAVALLEQHAPDHTSVLAWHLLDLGRVKEAVALLQQVRPAPAGPWGAA